MTLDIPNQNGSENWPSFKGFSRPNKDTICVQNKIIVEIAKILRDWLKGYKEEVELDTLYADARILNRRAYEDGYHLTKILDNNGWEVDSDLVERLDFLPSMISTKVMLAETQWVIDNNITPELRIGNKVKVKYGFGTRLGVISSISITEAKYYISALNDTDFNGKLIVSYEDVIEVLSN